MKYKDFTFVITKNTVNIVDDTSEMKLIQNDKSLIKVYSNIIDSYVNDNLSIYINGYIQLKKEYTKDDFFDIKIKIIDLYNAHGDSFLDYLSGTFIIIIYNQTDHLAKVYRDKLGGESAYYYTDDEMIIIASRLNLLTKFVRKNLKINTAIIPSYLYHHYIVSPFTIFENVFKVKSGEKVSLTFGNFEKSIVSSLVTDYFSTNRDKKITTLEAQTTVDRLLKTEIQALIKNKKVGTFLSGGIDSSLITAITQYCNDTKIQSYSIGFLEDKFDEAVYAAEIAKVIGVDHKVYYMDDNKILEYINKITEVYDEPYADSSQIATMYAYDIAASEVDIVLGGDGGDEFFYGYNMFENNKKLQKIKWIIYPIASIIKFLHLDEKIRLPKKVNLIVDRDKNKSCKTQFYSTEKLKRIKKMVLDTKVIEPRFLLEHNYKTTKWDEQLMMVHFETSLPDDMMIKVDRPAKYNGFYPASPLLSDSIIQYSHKIPLHIKYSKELGKKNILKRVLFTYVPKVHFERPKKGFSVPLKNIIRQYLWESILELSEKSRIEKQSIFNHEYLIKELNLFYSGGNSIMQDRDIFAYYIFQKWYQRNIENE